MKKTLLFLVVFLVVLGLIAPAASAYWGYPYKNVRVMTRNLYLGADIFRVVDAAQTDPALIPGAVAGVFQTMLSTNFWARAEAIADEIAYARPHVVGLQEVSTFYIQTPGDFLAGNPVQAETVVIDFYTVLDAALRARGMYYKAFTIENADVELPMYDPAAGPPYLSDVRLVDHDVILVRRGIPAWEVLAGNYDHNLEAELGGGSVEFTRGFVIVDAIIKGKIFRIVNTHLEVSGLPGSIFRVFQSAQMFELLGTIDYLDQIPFLGHRPIIVLGDFNSAPEDIPGKTDLPGVGEVDYVPPYLQAVNAGYRDAWLEQTSPDEGYTSGFDEYIDDKTDELTTRIDLIFVDPYDMTIEKVDAAVVGDQESDMVPNPSDPGSFLWPSDHAGVVARIKFSQPYWPWWKRFRWWPK